MQKHGVETLNSNRDAQRWYKYILSRTSFVLAEIIWPNLSKKSVAESLMGLSVIINARHTTTFNKENKLRGYVELVSTKFWSGVY